MYYYILELTVFLRDSYFNFFLTSVISNTIYITSLMLLDFFPFGIGNGDTVGPRAVDASSKVMYLDVPIIFYQKAETDLYVSLITNGLV